MARARRDRKTSGRDEASQRTPKGASARQGQRAGDGNQGEGNRAADRRYREGAAGFDRSGRVPKAAQEARRSVEDDERRARSGRDERDRGVEDDDRPADETKHNARERSRPS